MNDDKIVDLRDKFCVIGAGAAGLAVLKTFQSHGIPCDCFEQNDDVGGIWYYGTPHSSVYHSTHLISSKRYAEYIDFPMPAEYPAYPSRTQVLEYLRSYARKHQLYDVIQFNRPVAKVESTADHWKVNIQNESQTRLYRGVVVANGHLSNPYRPTFQGSFDGEVLHARDYKLPQQLVGKRVLVVGIGNSGCDIAVESGRHALKTLVSVRRGHYFVPKFLFGKPIDAGSDFLYRIGAPQWIHRLVSTIPLNIAVGKPKEWGLPIPDHSFLDEPPIPNTDLLHAIGHGRVSVKPKIVRLLGDKVEFDDGSKESIDTIILATGYRMHFPFLCQELWREDLGLAQLYLNAFHPRFPNLMFAGLFDASVKTWELVERQTEIMAHFIQTQNKARATELWSDIIKAHCTDQSNGRTADDSKLLYREYFEYRRRLTHLLKSYQKQVN